MSKLFTATMNLPIGSVPHSNLSKYSETLNRISASLGHTVVAFVADGFIKNENISPVEVKAGSQSFSVCDASEKIAIALRRADQYNHHPEIHKDFLIRLKGLLSREFPDLMAHAACYLGVDLSATLEADWTVIEDAFNSPAAHQVAPSTSYSIGSHEVDAVFHLSRIVSFLCRPFTGLCHHGAVIICHSLSLLPFFSIFSRIIEQAAAPTNLFTFLPVLAEMPNVSVTANFSIILKSADIDSAVRACVASLVSGGGTKPWKPYIILVEEAVLPRVLNRLKSTLTNSAYIKTSPYGIFNQLEKIERYLKDTVLCDGGEVITPDRALNGPFFITNMELSVLTRFPFEDLPISHLFPFRTAKEAAALASHCFNLVTSCYDPILYSRKPVNICANLWTSSFTVAWYMATSLLKSGFSNVFVNVSHQQLVSKMYALSLEPNRVDLYSSTKNKAGSVTKASLEQTSIVKLLSAALKAQLIWNGVTPRDREKQLRLASDNLGINSKSVFKRMCQLFTRTVEKSVGNLDNSELVPLTNGHPQLAHEWLLPTGPIVVVVPGGEPASLLLHVCLYALLAGNAVIIICWKDTVHEKVEEIQSLRDNLSNDGLISVYTCAPSCTMCDILNVLSETYHPGIVIPPSFLEASDDANDSDGLMANSEKFQPWTTFFKRSAKLFWSIGDKTFID